MDVRKSGHTYFVNTIIKERQAGIFIADEGALLDKADEHLGFGHQRVKLLVWAIAALQEPWKHQGEGTVLSYLWWTRQGFLH